MLEKLLEAILLGTKDNTIIWKIENSLFNSDLSHQYTCALNSDTKVNIRILLNNDSSFFTVDHLIINNAKLITGQKFLSRLDSIYEPFIMKIGNELYDRYIKINIKPHDSEDSIFGDILGDMPNKAQLRDDKISKILSTDIDDKNSIIGKIKKLLKTNS